MQEKIENRHPQTPAQVFNKGHWSTLNNRQKAKLLLGNERLMDAEIFLQDFISFEQPEFTNNLKVQAALEIMPVNE